MPRRKKSAPVVEETRIYQPPEDEMVVCPACRQEVPMMRNGRPMSHTVGRHATILCSGDPNIAPSYIGPPR
jgi:hypothetical protein